MTTFTTEDRINAEIEPIPFFGVVVINSEKIRVYFLSFMQPVNLLNNSIM
jgi:hypothetical protein